MFIFIFLNFCRDIQDDFFLFIRLKTRGRALSAPLRLASFPPRPAPLRPASP